MRYLMAMMGHNASRALYDCHCRLQLPDKGTDHASSLLLPSVGLVFSSLKVASGETGRTAPELSRPLANLDFPRIHGPNFCVISPG